MTTLVLQPASEGAGVDTAIGENAPTFSWGGASSMRVGWQPSAKAFRGLIQFDLSSIPANATVVSATLALICVNEDSADDIDVAAHRSLVQWYEGDGVGSAPPSADGSVWSYRNYNGSVAWAGGAGGGSGSDYAAGASATTTITQASDTEFGWDVSSDVQNFVDGTYTNYGWWLIPSAYAGLNAKYFATSGDFSARYPKLTVIYIVMVGSAAFPRRFSAWARS